MFSLQAIITTCVAIIGLIVGSITIYEKIIKPNRRKTKLRNAVNLINDWFEYIDCNLEKGIDFPILENKEKKVFSYIDANLKNYNLKLNNKISKVWLKEMGFKKSLLDSKELFTRYSRMLPEGENLYFFFTKIMGNFYNFHSKYTSTDPSGCNIGEVEMPIKFLNFLVK